MNNYTITSDDYELANDEAHFLSYYPKPMKGRYSPQPYCYPDKYPCLFKEVCTNYVSNGPDEAIIHYEYDFKENKQ